METRSSLSAASQNQNPATSTSNADSSTALTQPRQKCHPYCISLTEWWLHGTDFPVEEKSFLLYLSSPKETQNPSASERVHREQGPGSSSPAARPQKRPGEAGSDFKTAPDAVLQIIVPPHGSNTPLAK